MGAVVIAVGSVALTEVGAGWPGCQRDGALWRFTGDAVTTAGTAQRGVAVSFWLTALPRCRINRRSVVFRDLGDRHQTDALLLMPVLGWEPSHRVGERLGSGPPRARAGTCVL